MNDYEIFTDASADMAAGAAEKYGVRVIPMRYTLQNEEKIWHGTENDAEKQAFYQAERRGEEVKSTQINPATYEEVFEPYLKAGKDILYLCLSGGLSQTYSSSLAAAEALKKAYPERKIVCVDSLSATVGPGFSPNMRRKTASAVFRSKRTRRTRKARKAAFATGLP